MTRARNVWGIATLVSDKVAKALDLNVWHPQARVIMAGSQKDLAAAINETVGRVGKYGSPTGNPTELALAARYPGIALATSLHGDKFVWVRLDTEEVVPWPPSKPEAP